MQIRDHELQFKFLSGSDIENVYFEKGMRVPED
jgi:hypothetical protein